ncbi:hypothetical protein BUALT_Bualt03G0175000 [Buddleja alternifolia]|uniref:Uncharacterized protein n=1 Tax=Buddleja alternifolia TaxID=168488 RepID=A0AAV6XWD2_9LAMI|nr:hypothetical protein BUALT_Bualt03G0175000 [Buddleja alternifolia]
MRTKRRELGGSWWWAGGSVGGGRGGENQPGNMFDGVTHQNLCHNGREVAALGGGYVQLQAPAMQLTTGTMIESYQQSNYIEEHGNIDSDLVHQACYPRPRLRWTPELHDHFVKAVNELGGANKVQAWQDCKKIVEIKRISSTTRLLSSHECGNKTLEAETHANFHVLVEGAVKNSAVAETFSSISKSKSQQPGTSTTNAAVVKLEEGFATDTPALLPLFPPIPSTGIECPPHYYPEWSELLDGGGKKSVVPPHIDNSTMDDYLNTLGYSSQPGRASMRFGSFFDDVASFSKVANHNGPLNDDNVVVADVL